MKLKRFFCVLFLVVLLALSGCSISAPAIKNADFSDCLFGWIGHSYTNEGADFSFEDGAAVISASSENDVRLIQELDVSPNTTYRITCDIRTENVVGGAGANIGVYGVAVTSTPVLGTNDWTTVELVGKTAAGQRKLQLSVGVGGHGALASGKAWFDNVKIEKAENSSNAVLLGSSQSSGGSSSAPSEFPTMQILSACAVASSCFLLFMLWHRSSARKPLKVSLKGSAGAVILILLAALALRLALAAVMLDITKLGGHKTDINCFTAWGMRVLNDGPAHFYDSWCDYPPAYMLVLGGMAGLAQLFGGSHAALVICVKLPAIIADLLCAYAAYRLAERTMSRGASLSLMALVAFTPVAAYVSSAWGQIDQVLALLIILPIILLYKRRLLLFGLVYGLGVAVKPQALMFGPILAAACILFIIDGDPYANPFTGRRLMRLFKVNRDSAGLRLLETAVAVIAALGMIFLIALPFRGGQEPLWLVKKYFDTATSYKYATVNAYNFWALIGANWKSTETPFLGLTYGKWGTVFMALFVVLGIALYVFAAKKHKNPKGALPLAMAYSLAGLFTFGHYMHERYVFPALMLIIMAYIFYNDRRLIWLFFAYSVTLLVNCVAAFYYSELFEYGLYWDERIVFWCSLANVVLFAAFTLLSFILMLGNKPKKAYNG